MGRHPSTITKRAPVIKVTRAERSAARILLSATVKELRSNYRNVQVCKAWVYTKDGVNWEFKGPNKYSVMIVACCAFEARAKGWKAWMSEARWQKCRPV